MKKQLLFIVTASLFFISVINAQVRKGAIFLGGDIGGSTQKTTNNGTTINKQNSINISPVFGMAIKENLVFGVDFGTSLYKNDNNGTPVEQKQKAYSAGIFLRKYKPLGKSGFLIFIHGRLAGAYNSTEQKGYNGFFDNIKRHTIGLSAYPGVSYTISKRLQLETGFNNLLDLYYFKEKRDVGPTNPNTNKTSGFAISSSIDNLSSLYVGFRVLIN